MKQDKMRELRIKEIKTFNEKDWGFLQTRFNQSYHLYGTIKKTFGEIMTEIFKMQKIDCTQFEDCTQLDKKYFTLFKKNDYKPKMKTFITVCMGLSIESTLVESLLSSIDSRFKANNRVHYAYYYLVKNFNGISLEECNTILKNLGISQEHFLGNGKCK